MNAFKNPGPWLMVAWIILLISTWLRFMAQATWYELTVSAIFCIVFFIAWLKYR